MTAPGAASRRAAAPAPRATPAAALGLVVVPVATDVPQLRLRDRTLLAHATTTLSAVPGLDALVVGGGGRTGLPGDGPWRTRAGAALVLHDPCCPLLPATVVEECLRAVAKGGPRTAVVGVRPVTDTIKEVVGGAVVTTVERESLAVLASPVVVGADLLDPLSARFPRARDLGDLSAVVRALTELGTVLPVEVPWSGWRVNDAEDVDVLECLHQLHQVLQES